MTSCGTTARFLSSSRTTSAVEPRIYTDAAEFELCSSARDPIADVDQLGAPRSAVRHALDVLEQDGLIVRHVGRDTFLAQDSTRRHRAGRHHAHRNHAGPAAPRTPDRLHGGPVRHLNRMDHCLKRGGGAPDYAGFESWDSALHRAIAIATHNTFLLKRERPMSADSTFGACRS
jgi:hypothetical protein